MENKEDIEIDVAKSTETVNQGESESNHAEKVEHSIEESEIENTPSLQDYLNHYFRKMNELLEYLSLPENSGNKHSIVHQALRLDYVNKSMIDDYIKRIDNHEGECDFCMIGLLRFYYLTHDMDSYFHKNANNKIIKCLKNFPYWPTEQQLAKKSSANMDEIVFWSENHLLMTLGTCYLVNQVRVKENEITKSEMDEMIETQLLLKYLTIHCHERFPGMYEVNSHVYFPYSMSGLLNLYDFAEDPRVKEMSENIIDRALPHLLLTTDPITGIANLSASARAFLRTRLRNFDHNVNQLIRLFASDECVHQRLASAITDFITTTSWRPKLSAFEALHFDGFQPPIQCSHKLSDIDIIYGKQTSSTNDESLLDEHTPLYWSAGLITHPQFAAKTRCYQRHRGLKNNKHLWPVSFFFLSDLGFQSSMESYDHFSTGQLYTDIQLAVYKKPHHRLIMSSFHLYNPHHVSFQQLPWMVNFDGIPIWSQSGLGSESIAGFAMTNTHNPAVQQDGDLLLQTYIRPPTLHSMVIKTIFNYKVRFFWPMNYFDEHRVVEYVKPRPNSSGDSWDYNSWATKSNGASNNNEAISDSSQPKRKKKSMTSAATSSLKSVMNFVTTGHTKPRSERKQNTDNSIHPTKDDELLLQSKSKVWCIGRRNDAFIAICCTKPIIYEGKETDDANFQETKQSSKKSIPRLYCHDNYHSWIVLVGTTEDYSSIDDFIHQRVQHIMIEEKYIEFENIYQINVLDITTQKSLVYVCNTENCEKLI